MAYTPAWSTADRVLYAAELLYGPLLLSVYLVLAVYSSIGSVSRTDEPEKSESVGPEGKPLPSKARSWLAFSYVDDFSIFAKRLMAGFNGFVCVSFLAHALVTIYHVYSAASDLPDGEAQLGWWCGEETAVSP